VIAAAYAPRMGLVIALIVLAIVLGVVGLAVAALKWLLIIAVVLLVVGVARAAIGGRRGR
jgi:hypothetical protein